LARFGKSIGAADGATTVSKYPVILVVEEESPIRLGVSAEAIFAATAIYEGVSEMLHVARGFPYLGMHKDATVKPDHVIPLLYDRFPPGIFDVVFK